MDIKKGEIVGILGGMGPYAALEFCKQILDATPAKKDWEHIHFILDNNSKIPSRTRHILYNEEDPTPYIIESINKLATFGATKVFLPCNSVHYFYDKVTPYIDIPWINILDIVAQKIKKSQVKKTIVLGAYTTVTKRLYSKYLENLIYLNIDDNNLVYEIIEEVKLNNLIEANNKSKDLIKRLDKYGFDSVILACTELTLLPILVENSNFISFDSGSLYVEYIVNNDKRKSK